MLTYAISPPEATTSNSDIPPTLDEWRALYDTFNQFGRVTPWIILNELHIFGVQNPETLEFGYCNVIGGPGEEPGLALFRKISSVYDGLSLSDEDEKSLVTLVGIMESQDAITASLGGRDGVSEPDRLVMKALGLRFRGKLAWPVFRSLLPGCAPWYLTGAEARFLTVALAQAIQVTRLMYKGDVAVPEFIKSDKMLFRICEKSDAGLVWRNELRAAPKPERQIIYQLPSDDEDLDSLLKYPATDEIWELVHVPLPILTEGGSSERPMLTYQVVAVLAHYRKTMARMATIGGKIKQAKQSSRTILNGTVLDTDRVTRDRIGPCIIELIRKIIETRETRPAEFVVVSDDMFQHVRGVAKSLGIPVTRSKNAPATQHAWTSLIP